MCCSESKKKIAIKDVFDTRFGINLLYNIVHYTSCGLFRTDPIPNHFELNKLYEQYYNFAEIETSQYDRIQSDFFAKQFSRFWVRLDGDVSFYSIKGKGRLLDIGCNEGRGLRVYEQNGFEAEGLEINKIAAAKAKKHGFKVITEYLENYKPKRFFDVVVLSNVLEHSLNPNKMLEHVSKVLRLGGEVWISCPNIESWQRKLFGRYWINWHVPFHIFHFSKISLAKLLTANGFKIIKEKQKSPSLWLSQSLISRFFSIPNRPTKQLRKAALLTPLMIFIRFLLFPILWIGNLLNRGDCLVVMAKKV